MDILYKAEMPESMKDVILPFEECLKLEEDTRSFFLWIAYDTEGFPEKQMLFPQQTVLFKLGFETDDVFWDIDRNPIEGLGIAYPAPFIKN